MSEEQIKVIDVSTRLPLSVTYRDLLFEATKEGFHELLIKRSQREIIVFNEKEMK